MIFKNRERDYFWYKNWSRWFAWYPVRLDNSTMVWLEVVERKDENPLSDYIVWEYRRLKKV